MTFRTTKEIESFNREVKQLIIDHATSTDRLDFIRERVVGFITNEEGTPFVVSETKKEFLEEQERKKAKKEKKAKNFSTIKNLYGA